jgi:cell division protein FtsI (penicillin-binding protein 3)
VHDPDTSTHSYYGADVAGPVFKRVAQKIFTDAPSTNEIKNLNRKNSNQEVHYADFEVKTAKAQEHKKTVPNLYGMSGMDAVAILGNLGIKVKIKGVGKVRKQSINSGEIFQKNTTIYLELS